MTDPRIGTDIGGYRIEELIGRGGMGVVYRAEQIALGRRVALKLVAPELAEDPGFRERFQRESRLAASIEHPNVIPVHEAGEAEGSVYISMRYVDGTDLRLLIREQGQLEPARAARLVAQVGDALDAAHASGLVHRDVKPANVVIGTVGGHEHAYLTDFGLTKHASSQGGLTRTGEWVGTVDYVAPEQISGGGVDARSDVYALGCVLFQALTGSVPFERDSDVAKMYAHLHEPPPSPLEVAPDLPPALAGVVARALAKDPGNRYQSAGDLGRAAVAAAENTRIAEPERSVARGSAASGLAATVPAASPAPTAPAAAPTARLPFADDTPPTQAVPPARRGRGVAIGVAAAVLGAALLAGGLLAAGVFDSEDEPRRSSGPVAVDTGTSEPEPVPGDDSDIGRTDEEPPTETAGFTTYEAATYTAEYPAEWRVTEDDQLKTTYSRTKFQSPDDSQSVLIDRSPGKDEPPAQSAKAVESQTAKTPGYERISFEPTTVGGREAYEWTFSIDGERKVDIFVNAGGEGFAVLGAGDGDFSALLADARGIAESIQPR